MTEARLGGDGVLVTRPAHLADELADAVTAAGGRVISFPVIDILPVDPATVAGALAQLAPADIVIFISRNAVQHGLDTLDGKAAIAAIGPATRDALERAGRRVDIEPAGGFASEDLLAEPALADVAGKRIRIIRGTGGRELLADTLVERGAAVDYLDVYRREPHRFSRDELATLARRWRAGDVRFVTAMSVASLDNLLRLLPAACLKNLAAAQLVTPSTRVIQTALERIPAVPALLAKSPRATHMVEAMVAGRGRTTRMTEKDSQDRDPQDDQATPETSQAETAPETGRDDAARDDVATEDTVQSTPAPRPSRLPLAISSLALFVALIAIAASAFIWLGERGPDDVAVSNEAAIADLREALQEIDDAQDGNRRQLSALGDRDSELEDSIERVERSLERQERALEAVPGRLSAVEASLAALQGISAGVLDTWTLAEAEYFMEIANAQLNLARNPELALAALELADERIAKLAAPGLTDVRQALSDELRALESLEAPDIEGAALTLASLAGTVESLPLREGIVPPGQQPVDVADELSGMERALASLRSAMSDVVSVRRTDQPVRPLLPPDSVYFLRSNLKLQLQAARLALLQNEQALFEQSLDDAADWLREYFDPEATPVSSALDTISELKQGHYSLMRIDISRSLTLLRRYVALQASERDAATGAEQ